MKSWGNGLFMESPGIALGTTASPLYQSGREYNAKLLRSAQDDKRHDTVILSGAKELYNRIKE